MDDQQPLLGPSPFTTDDEDNAASSTESSLLSNLAKTVRGWTSSINSRSDYIELKGKEEEIKTDKKDEKKEKPDDRFFRAVAMALLDKANTNPEVKTRLEKFLGIKVEETNRKDLGRLLRQKCTDYTAQLHEFSEGTAGRLFLNDRYWNAFQQHQDNAFKRPEYAHITRGAIPGQREPAFFTEKSLTGNDKVSIAQFLLGLEDDTAPRKTLAAQICKAFSAFTLSRTPEFARLRDQYAKAADDAARENIKKAMLDHCATTKAIETYLFDEARLSPIYYSAAFNEYFSDADNPFPRGNKTNLVDYLMTRTKERDSLRVELGAEILTIFQKNPAFSTPEFKRLNDAPIRDEAAIKQYCESREAIKWYVMNTDYQKHLHYLQASRVIFSSKTFFLTSLASVEEKASAQEKLQPLIAEALKSCRKDFPNIELPENYEALCKQYNGIGNAAVENQPKVVEAIEKYAGSEDAYFWYIKTYLTHPDTLVPAECLDVLQDTLDFSVRIWQKTDDTKELEFTQSKPKEKSPHTVDVVVMPDTNPVQYRILNRFNFNPLGEYSEFCNNYVTRAMDTLSWIKKTMGPEKYEAHRKTMATHAGNAEIHGVILCDVLAQADIPVSMYVPRPRKKDYLFVDHNGCARNLSAVERYQDNLTITIEEDNEGRFLPVLSTVASKDFDFQEAKDWGTDIEVDLAFGKQLRTDDGSPVTIGETVETRTPDQRKGTTEAYRDTLQYIREQSKIVDVKNKKGEVTGQREVHFVAAKKIDIDALDDLPPAKELPLYKKNPIQSKTAEEIDLEKYDSEMKINGGSIQNFIHLETMLRKTGEPYREVERKEIFYKDIPEPEPAKFEPAIMQELAERPPMPSFAPAPLPKPVTLEKAVQSGFTHNPLQPKKEVPEVVLLEADKKKRDVLINTVPKQFQLGQASEKDSFFDAVAQQLNTFEGSNKYDIKLVRAIANRMEGDANPEVDGQIICAKMGVSLHVVTLQQGNTVKHFLTDKNGTEEIKENSIRWNDKKILHIAVNNHQEKTKTTQRFVPITKKPVKDNGLFDAVAKALDNVVFGTTKVSKDEFFTETYLREACEHHLTSNLPDKNWVRTQLNSDPDNADYFESTATSQGTDSKKYDKGKTEASDATVEVPLTNDNNEPTLKKTPYRIYTGEVRYTSTQKEKTLPVDRDLELRLMCESLAATGKKIKIQVFEVQEEDVADDKGVFHRKKVIKNHYLQSENGREEISDSSKVNWGSDKIVTLIYDKDNDHFESCGSHLPRTWSFFWVNFLVHTFYGASLSFAMGMQALSAGVPAIMREFSAQSVIDIMIGSGAGKWLLLWFYAWNKFGGFPSTLNKVALDIYNLDDHIKAMIEALHTGDWSWGSDVLPKMGGVALALFPAFFFGGLNKLILIGPEGFPATVLNNKPMFTGWASGMIGLADFINNHAEAAYRLAFFSSFVGNLISARPIVEQIKRIIDKCIRDAKNVRDKGMYENIRFWLGILTGLGISVFVILGFINFWQLSSGLLYAGMIGSGIPGAMLGYILSAGIMAFIAGLGFCAAMPLGRKFMEYLFDICAGDLQFEDGDFRKDNPEYQGFRAWWSEQTSAHKGLFIAAYAIAGGIVVAGAFPNVFQADLADDTKFFAGCAFLASMITELEGTETVFEGILHKIAEFFNWIGVKISDLYQWLKEVKADVLPFPVELQIRLVNALEKHFPSVCKPRLSNWAYTQRYSIFEPVQAAAAQTATASTVPPMVPVYGN